MNTPVLHLIEEKGHIVHQTSPEVSVREAVRMMNERHIGALLVTRSGRPVGMFTERDVLTRVVDAGLDPETTPVGTVMSTRLTVIRPDTPMDDAMRIITQRRHRHLPVIDADGRIVGLVSIGDLTRWTVRDHESLIDNLNEYIWGATSV